MSGQKRSDTVTRLAAVTGVLCTALVALSATVACSVVYPDYGLASSGTAVAARVRVSDDYSSSGREASAWSYLENAYQASVSTVSANQRSTHHDDSTAQGFGGGYASASGSLSVGGETGTLEIHPIEAIASTVAGQIVSRDKDASEETLCPDTEVDRIVKEYRPAPAGTYEGGVSPAPGCGSINRHDPSYQYSENFNWSELNGGFSDGNPHQSYGMISSSLINGLEATRRNYGFAIRVTSGYRCPHGNRDVDSGRSSLHMQGRAADLYSWHRPWTEDEFVELAEAARLTNPAELIDDWSYYKGHHLHVAW